MIITTTNSIEGYSVRKYLGVVNANVVLGTNLFSDFTASLSDVFGGHSGTYKNKLNLIYNEVMKEVSKNAESYHADAILGLHINFDEISGGGKSMFMVSASGTVVTLEKNNVDRYFIYDMLEKIVSYRDKGILTNEEFNYEKNRILELHKNPISEEYQKAYQEQQEWEKEELQRMERINEAKELLKERTGCSIDDIKNINEYQLQLVSYDDISFDSNDSMQYIISKFIRLNRIPEACKFYMDETGLKDLQAAIDYCLNVYKQIANVDTEKVAALIPKLKVLKKRGFIQQAVSEYQQLTISDKQTSEAFISSLKA